MKPEQMHAIEFVEKPRSAAPVPIDYYAAIPGYANGSFLRITLAMRCWHVFRRGLATNPHRLGVSDKVIQQILQHANVNTTMNVYVKAVSADAANAMRTLETICATRAARKYANHVPVFPRRGQQVSTLLLSLISS